MGGLEANALQVSLLLLVMPASSAGSHHQQKEIYTIAAGTPSRRRMIALHHAKGVAFGILAVGKIAHARNGHSWCNYCAAVGFHSGDHIVERGDVDRIDHRWHAGVAPHDRAVDTRRVGGAGEGKPVIL